MTQKRVASIAFVLLLMACCFELGYLVGDNQETPEVHMTQIEEVSKSQPNESISTAPELDVEEKHGGLIDINTADQLLLETLPGIGASLASRIIDYRETIGGFTAKEQIMQVSGIGQKKYESLQALITVGGQ